jgi:hypothetical protein
MTKVSWVTSGRKFDDLVLLRTWDVDGDGARKFVFAFLSDLTLQTAPPDLDPLGCQRRSSRLVKRHSDVPSAKIRGKDISCSQSRHVNRRRQTELREDATNVTILLRDFVFERDAFNVTILRAPCHLSVLETIHSPAYNVDLASERIPKP